MLPYETYKFKQKGKTISIKAWIFCESKTQLKNLNNTDETISNRVRFYITDKSRVLLEYLKLPQEDKSEHLISEHETLEDAVNELAFLPLNIVTQELYDLVMDDMLKRARSNQDDD